MKIKKISSSIITVIFILIFLNDFAYSQPAKKNPASKSTKSKSSSKKKVAKPKKTGKKEKKKSDAKKKAAAKKKREEDRKKQEQKRITYIERTLDYGISSDRIDAINKIQLIKSKTNRDKLYTRLIDIVETDRDSSVTVKALSVIGEMKVKGAIPAIITRLDDPIEDVQVEAIYSLKRLKAKSAKQAIIKRFKKQKLSEDSQISVALIHFLGELKSSELIEYAQKAIEDTATTKNLREQLILFLGKTGSTKAAPFLMKLFKDPEEDIIIRSYAVHSLGGVKATEAIKTIREVLKEIESYPFKKKKRYFKLQLYSITALVRLGDNSAVPRLMSSLKSDNAMVRLRAVSLLKDLKDKRTIDILKYKMDYDPSDKVRKKAKEALKAMGVDVDKKKKKDKKK